MIHSIRQRDIEILPDDPFVNDLLDRKHLAESLTNLVAKFESPYVVAIDAAWGAGKSTFIKIWTQELRNQNYPVVQFNAWKNDFAGNAMVALSSELTDALRKYDSNIGKVDEIRETVKKIFENSVVAGVRLATSGIVELDSIGNKGDILASYEESRTLTKQFKENLELFAKKVKEQENCPVVVVIDELDRCRPLYAIELLEVAKHMFSVENIVFVLAINLRELGHSIKAVYGRDFNSHEYLERFIDITIPLPKAEREQFIWNLMSERTVRVVSGTGENSITVRYFIMNLLGSPEMNLRRVAHYVKRLNILLTSIDNEPDVVLAAVVALIARAYDSENCFKFYYGEITDREFANSLFKNIGLRRLNSDLKGTFIAAVVISAQYAIKGISFADDSEFKNSTLLENYHLLSSSNISPDQDEKDYAINVIKLFELFRMQQWKLDHFGRDYLDVMEHITLLLPRGNDNE